MTTITNEPMEYDDHGDIPFEVPFSEIPTTEISLYLQLDTRVGKATCRQHCSHCFFIREPEARGRFVDLAEGRRIWEALSAQGYKVFPMIADSFANGGEFLRVFGNSHIREYREGSAREETKTMQRGEAWTSGAALLGEDWENLLETAVSNGFGAVTITFHGVLKGDLELAPAETYPIKGVFSGQDCVSVIERLHAFNARRLAASGAAARSAGGPLQINLGVTVGTHNWSHESLLRYGHLFNRLGVSVARFNCFHDHGGRHPDLSLSREQIAAVYQSLKWIHRNVPLGFQLGVSEDFGTSGIEVMEFPRHVGHCRAGRQLFAIVPEQPRVLRQIQGERVEEVGSVAGCVDAFKPRVGRLLRRTRLTERNTSYDLEFFQDVIEELRCKRVNGTYRDGCFAPELLAELQHQQEAATQLVELKVLATPTTTA
jgi:hypothetical protein